MWNVKCGVSENIKEGKEPWGACKINDPDWLLRKTKRGEKRLLYVERLQFKFLCVLWSAEPKYFTYLKTGRLYILDVATAWEEFGQVPNNRKGFDFLLAYKDDN